MCCHRIITLETTSRTRRCSWWTCEGTRTVREWVLDSANDRLVDPPDGVRREPVAEPLVELLDGADQADRAFLDEVAEREAGPAVGLGLMNDEAQVVPDEGVLQLGDPCFDVARIRDGRSGRAA